VVMSYCSRGVVLLAVIALLCARCDAAVPLEDDLNDVSYTIEFIPAGVIGDKAKPISTDRWTVMTATNGTKYDCLLPEADGDGLREDPLKRRDKLVDTVVPVSVKTIVGNILKEFCVIRGTGWWVYEMCWPRQVRQYHADAHNRIETEYMLGMGPSHKIEKGATDELRYGYSPVHGMYIAARFYNGTACDLTGKQRWTEVRLSCMHEEDESGSLGSLVDAIEVETCVYTVNVKHAKLCDIPELRKEQKPVHTISCYTRES
jgi:protein OS-9